MAETTNRVLTYKGRTLVRSGGTIYLGSMADKHVGFLQILSVRKEGDLEMADRVSAQVLLTDIELRPRDRVVKKTEKNNLYDALNIVSIWLDRLNA